MTVFSQIDLSAYRRPTNQTFNPRKGTMRTFNTTVTIEEKHLDAGQHANWLQQIYIAIMQLQIAVEVHFMFRKKLGIGLETLLSEHHLFLVMRKVENVEYFRELELGDEVTVVMIMGQYSQTRIFFRAEFSVGGKVATRMMWVMPLVKKDPATGQSRPCRLPEWMIQILNEQPVAV